LISWTCDKSLYQALCHMKNNNIKTISCAFALAVLGSTTQSNAALTLFSAWDLNEGSGTVTTQYQRGSLTWNQVTNPTANLSATASNNIGLGGGSWGAASPAPNSTASLTFDGTGSTNEVNTNVSGLALGGTGAKTFVAWINPTAGNGTVLSFSPGAGSTNGGDLRLLVDGNGDLRGEVSGGFFVYDGTSLLNDGWKMVAAIFDGNTNTSSFYIGGMGLLTPNDVVARAIDTRSTVDAGKSNAVGEFVIGGDMSDPSRAFSGGIDMVAVYEGAATLSELNSIYSSGVAIPEPSTIALLMGGVAALVFFRRRRN